MTTLKSFTRRLFSLNAHERSNRLMYITARQMLKMAMEAEMLCYLERMNRGVSPQRKMRAVRNGYHKARPVRICGKAVFVKVPRARIRCDEGESFASRIVHRYVRRDLSFNESIPLAYLDGVACGSMNAALEMILAHTQAGLSAIAAGALAENWNTLQRAWKGRNVRQKRYACLWIEAVQRAAAVKNGRSYTVAIIGADRINDAELLDACYYPQEDSRQDAGALFSLVSRGLKEPEIVVAGGIPEFAGELKRYFKKSRFVALDSEKN